jgi:hypothetical protein
MSNVEITPRRLTVAFMVLEKVLMNRALPDGHGDYVKCVASDFMLMSMERLPGGGKRTAFKHYETRNYVWLEKGRLVLGDGTSPFQRHEFGPLNA